MGTKKTQTTSGKEYPSDTIIQIDNAIQGRARELMKSLSDDLRKWADAHGVCDAEELQAIALCAFLPEGKEMDSVPRQLVCRITDMVINRITSISIA